MVVANHEQRFLQNVIAKLVVDQLLNDEIHSSLKVQRFAGFETKLLNDLVIIVWEGAFENLVNMSLLNGLIEFRIQTLLDDITWELKLTQSDEVFGNFLENAFVSFFIFKL